MRRFLLVVCLAACAGRAQKGAKGPGDVVADERPTKRITLDPVQIDVIEGTGGEKTLRAYDARSLLDEGNDALTMKRYDDALAAYEHLIADFPDSSHFLAAVYNAGLALEGKRAFDKAATRYREVIVKGPKDSRDVLDAQFRLGRVLAEGGKDKEAVESFLQVLERDDLDAADRIEALAREGASLVELGDYTAAEEVLRSALVYYRDVRATIHLDNLFFVAMAQYKLAEIPHRQFLAVALRYPEQQMERDLDKKSELFLLARDRYLKAVSYSEPYWGTAAYYQIGLIYKEFWDAWLMIPLPADLEPAAAKELIKELNKEPRLKQLLEQSMRYHEKNATFAKDPDLASVWTEASKVQVKIVKEIQERQARGDYLQPGTAPANPPVDADVMPDPGFMDKGGEYIPPRPEL